jgi:hypothetical protein
MRDKLLHLAHSKPELRKYLVPLLRQAFVKIDLKDTEESNLNKAKELAFESYQRTQKNRKREFDISKINKSLSVFDLGLSNNPTEKEVSAVTRKLILEKRVDYNDPNWDTYFEVSRELRALEDSLSSETLEAATKQLLESAEAENEANKKLAQAVAAEVEAAAKRADLGLPLTLKGSDPGVFSVQVGTKRGVNFTVFINRDTGKITQVEDVLEGGDLDFFHGPEGLELGKAYFDLIKEIQHPGSSSQGKEITLYTARPVKDRHQYAGASTLPPNLFLANDVDHVLGLAHDLGGGAQRDVWKVKINTRYLVLTNDAGRVKYYQIVGAKAVPVKGLELIIPAED